jgi:uncharacterized protein
MRARLSIPGSQNREFFSACRTRPCFPLLRKMLFCAALALLILSCRDNESQSVPSNSQILPSGLWEGTLAAGEQEILLRFDFSGSGKDLSAELSIPQQNVFSSPASAVKFSGEGELTVEFSGFQAVFTAEAGEQEISGSWKQGGMSYPLNLKRTTAVSGPGSRYQDPIPPYPYKTAEVSWTGTAGHTLAGTLTLPEGIGPFPGCILVSGSGQQNRDQDIFNHRPFHVIADELTRSGIAVLRYDDRGVGGSGGEVQQATSYDFFLDAVSALDYLAGQSEIDDDSLGVIGHSEGGLIAAMLAADYPELDWAVLLAAPGMPGDQLLTAQNEAIMRSSGYSEQQIGVSRETNELVYSIAVGEERTAEKERRIIRELVRAGVPRSEAQQQAGTLLIPWMVYYLRSDPASYLERVTIPVLALNGTKDLQVPAEENLRLIDEALQRAGNDDVTAAALENLNHLFQPAETGLVGEYALIETTFDPAALTFIRDWILERYAQ